MLCNILKVNLLSPLQRNTFILDKQRFCKIKIKMRRKNIILNKLRKQLARLKE